MIAMKDKYFVPLKKADLVKYDKVIKAHDMMTLYFIF